MTGNRLENRLKALYPCGSKRGEKRVRTYPGLNFARAELWDKALEIWEEVLKKNPESSAVPYNISVAYEVRGEPKRWRGMIRH